MASASALFDIDDAEPAPAKISRPAAKSLDGWFGRNAARQPERLTQNEAVREFVAKSEGLHQGPEQDFDRNERDARHRI